MVSFMTPLAAFVPLPVLFSLLSPLLLISNTGLAPAHGPAVDNLVVQVFGVGPATQRRTPPASPTKEEGTDTFIIATDQ